MYRKTTLGNGLRVVTSEMPHTRSVSVCFFVGTGSRYETDEQAGISHFIEHVCFKGTTQHPTAADICLAIEGVGGVVNAGTDKELTIYWGKVAQPHFQRALDVLVDILMNSRFEPEEIDKERQVIIEEINQSLDSPSQRAALLIDELLWPGHPLGRDIAGTKESVSAIDRDMILSYMRTYYQPGNTVLAVAGDIRHEDVIDTASRATSGWKDNQQHPSFTPYREPTGRRVLIEKRDIEQTNLVLALPGLSNLDPDRFKLDLLNVVLGEGMTSRLFTEIRDRLGLAYSINSFNEHLQDTGALAVMAGVDARNLAVAVKAIVNELSRLKTPIPDTELDKAKELFKGRLLLRMEDSRSVAGWLGSQEVLAGKILSVDEVVDAATKVTASEMAELAERLFSGDKLRLAAVGPNEPDEPLEEILDLL